MEDWALKKLGSFEFDSLPFSTHSLVIYHTPINLQLARIHTSYVQQHIVRVYTCMPIIQKVSSSTTGSATPFTIGISPVSDGSSLSSAPLVSSTSINGAKSESEVGKNATSSIESDDGTAFSLSWTALSLMIGWIWLDRSEPGGRTSAGDAENIFEYET